MNLAFPYWDFLFTLIYNLSAYLLQKTLRCISSENVTAKTSMAAVMNVAARPSATHRPSDHV